MRNASKGTYYRDPNYELNGIDIDYQADICLAELKAGRPYSCKALVKPRPVDGEAQKEHKPRAFSFDITKVNEIFDQLYNDKQIKLREKYKIPSSEAIMGKRYCK
ncbi:hypothetical protein Dimus_038898 [Dionaea muscipula]